MEQRETLRHWRPTRFTKGRKISSLTTIVRSFEDFFTYSMKIRTEGLKEDHGEEPWSLAEK